MNSILVHSAAPWCGTGYGQQTALLSPRLRAAGHAVEISAHAGLTAAQLSWDGITVYPGDDCFGNTALPRYLRQFDPDLLLTLLDVWVLKLETVRDARKVACWVPIDHEPTGELIRRFFEKTGATPIAMSRHGERTLRADGLDPVYVPHAIDTSVFQPYDRAESRDMFDLPHDAFLVGMVAANYGKNPSRKAFPEALRGFKRFRDDHPDALLYLHTSLKGPEGLNIGWLCDRLGIEPDTMVRGTAELPYELGLQPEIMARLYSSFDVLLSPSYGEGFGLAPVEAQACGVPVIVSDFTAQPELCGAGWLVDGEPWWVDEYRSWWQQPSVDSIVAALEDAYSARGDLRLKTQAREFALGYDADRVFAEHWLPALAKLLPSQVVMPSRAQRRAKAVA